MRSRAPNPLPAATAALVLALGAASARADEPAPPPPALPDATVAQPAPAEPKPPTLLLGVRAGGVFPQAFNKLDASFLVDVELGWQLPFFKNRFGLYLGGSYSQPTSSGRKTTSQIADPVDYKLTLADTGVTLGLQYLHFVHPRVGLLVGGGAKVHFTRNTVEQHAGSTDLGTNSEDSTRIGAAARAGAGIRLGPGMLTILVNYEWAPTKQLITGDDNTAFLGVQLGYTLFLL